MTISTTSDRITYQGDGANTIFTYSFLIPSDDDVVVTLTLISDSSTEELDPSVFSITGIDEATGGIVTYPLSGSPLSSDYNLTIQRVLSEIQETDLVNQSGYYPDVVESALDYATMLIQQVQGDVNQALAFPIGSLPADTSIPDLLTAILNGQANADAAAASAADAATSAATVLGLLPLATANIGDLQITTGKLASNAVTALKMGASAYGYVDGLVNGTLVASVAASALTVAIKTRAGTDPSATDPVYVIFRSATQATGDYTVITLTTAANVVISSGSTLGTTNAVPFRLWLVGFNDAGVFRLGIINCFVSATRLASLNEGVVASSTAEGGAGAADSAAVFYTGTAVSNKGFRILGYVDFSAGQATVGTWATAPDALQLFGPGVKKPGDAIQVVYATTAVAGATTSATYATLGPSPAVTITPMSACNKVKIDWSATINNGSASTIGLRLARDTTPVGGDAGAILGPGISQNLSGIFFDSFLTANAITYNIYGKTNAGTLNCPGSGFSGNLVATEYMG